MLYESNKIILKVVGFVCIFLRHNLEDFFDSLCLEIRMPQKCIGEGNNRALLKLRNVGMEE